MQLSSRKASTFKLLQSNAQDARDLPEALVYAHLLFSKSSHTRPLPVLKAFAVRFAQAGSILSNHMLNS